LKHFLCQDADFRFSREFPENVDGNYSTEIFEGIRSLHYHKSSCTTSTVLK